MVKVEACERLRYILVVFVLFFLKIEGLDDVQITIVDSAVDKGAVCLDGSPPAYQLDEGFGDGVNNWLVHIQGGGWCNTVEDCLFRTNMSDGLGSSKFMTMLNFTGILSNQQELNPNFYNWNRVFMRYCDGSSFTGDVEEVDPATNLHFRGAKVFDAIVEELLSKGMVFAENALLSGCSAGGLASIMHCDKFRGFFLSSTRVKCFTDAGYFVHVKDLSGMYHFEQFYDEVVTLHGSTKNLPPDCTSKMKPGLCFYPQFVMPYIQTPVFILNSAYDTWQVSYILTSNEADPNGYFSKCKMDLNECSTTQLQRLQEFRSDFLEAFSIFGNSSSRGMFINDCYMHCQSEFQPSWLGNPSSKLDDKSVAEAVGDWFYDKNQFQKIDTQNVSPHYC